MNNDSIARHSTAVFRGKNIARKEPRVSLRGIRDFEERVHGTGDGNALPLILNGLHRMHAA